MIIIDCWFIFTFLSRPPFFGGIHSWLRHSRHSFAVQHSFGARTLAALLAMLRDNMIWDANCRHVHSWVVVEFLAEDARRNRSDRRVRRSLVDFDPSACGSMTAHAGVRWLVSVRELIVEGLGWGAC